MRVRHPATGGLLQEFLEQRREFPEDQRKEEVVGVNGRRKREVEKRLW
jgi:hypothetical protein